MRGRVRLPNTEALTARSIKVEQFQGPPSPQRHHDTALLDAVAKARSGLPRAVRPPVGTARQRATAHGRPHGAELATSRASLRPYLGHYPSSGATSTHCHAEEIAWMRPENGSPCACPTSGVIRLFKALLQ